VGGSVNAALNIVVTQDSFLPAKDQSRNNFPISIALFDPKPQAMVF